jgi:hypothetical protein
VPASLAADMVHLGWMQYDMRSNSTTHVQCQPTELIHLQLQLTCWAPVCLFVCCVSDCTAVQRQIFADGHVLRHSQAAPAAGPQQEVWHAEALAGT